MLNDLIARIEAAPSILISSHVNPDGDAIGSSLGLWWVLRHAGKTVELSFADPAPSNTLFLPGIEAVQPRVWDGESLILCLDGSDLERYGADIVAARNQGATLLVIDHHKTNTMFGAVNWVDSTYVATAQMVYALVQAAGWTIPPQAATCLAAGCVTDSNGFSTAHTTPDVLEAVADLMRQGAALDTIMYYTRGVRTRSDAFMWGKILSNLQIEDGVAWAISYAADRKAATADEGTGSGIATFMRDIEGVNIGVLFTEVEPEVVRISMRSTTDYDVSTVALLFGGGGHRPAAGATLLMPVSSAIDTVIAKVKALVPTA